VAGASRCGHYCFERSAVAAQFRRGWAVIALTATAQRANACAYHVADVIEALRRWAAEHGVVDGALTILAIEPAAGGRQPIGEDRPDLRGFAFSTIPLDSGPR
jgi:hypothetical protein